LLISIIYYQFLSHFEQIKLLAMFTFNYFCFIVKCFGLEIHLLVFFQMTEQYPLTFEFSERLLEVIAIYLFFLSYFYIIYT